MPVESCACGSVERMSASGRVRHFVRVFFFFSPNVIMFCQPQLPCVSSYFMRDVHFVMSATLRFVHYVSHIVKTCIRRNFKSYPITHGQIVVVVVM